MPTNLEHTLKSFISVTDKSKVSVVIPLFGYFDDSSKQLNKDTLKLTLDRIYSNVHQLYLIFVAEEKRLSPSVGNILAAKNKGGNAKGISMKAGSTYGEYLRAGVTAALEDTKSQYIICINPWVLLQHNALDVLVDRMNRSDEAKVICGFDVNGIIESTKFDGHIYNIPIEERAIDTNLFGMKRVYAEMIPLDTKYKTHSFIGRDAWQSMLTKGFECIITQKVTIFSFNVDWTEFESREQYESDKAYFLSKWHYNVGEISYGK
jgi:hypothetical protein